VVCNRLVPDQILILWNIDVIGDGGNGLTLGNFWPFYLNSLFFNSLERYGSVSSFIIHFCHHFLKKITHCQG
jgi:hypothetical protein